VSGVIMEVWRGAVFWVFFRAVLETVSGAIFGGKRGGVLGGGWCCLVVRFGWRLRMS